MHPVMAAAHGGTGMASQARYHPPCLTCPLVKSLGNTPYRIRNHFGRTHFKFTPCGTAAGSSDGQVGSDAVECAEKADTILEDVVLLDVSGMHCASCSGRVRRLLEAQPHVTGATVSLATETALVCISIPPQLCSTAGAAGEMMLLTSPPCPLCHTSYSIAASVNLSACLAQVHL